MQQGCVLQFSVVIMVDQVERSKTNPRKLTVFVHLVFAIFKTIQWD